MPASISPIIKGYDPLLLHSIFEMLGIFIGFRYYLWLKRKSNDTISWRNRMLIVIAAMFGAVLGSRIIGSLENAQEWFASPSPWEYFYGNKTLVGGLVGGLAAVELIKKAIGEKQRSGDLFVYPLILAMMIGRIGCFFAGMYEETYGLPTNLPWGMNLGDGVSRHPVTLYEIAYLLMLWIVFRRVQARWQLKQGALFQLFMVSYLLFRFFLDFIKPGWRPVWGLGTIQLTCLAGLIYYYKVLLFPSSLIIKTQTYAR